MFSLLRRVYTAFAPPVCEKKDGALRFGVLGTAKVTPFTMIIPAKSHPEVIVQAVASRDRTRAEAFAKSHGIPEVKDSYQELIDDPDIDAIFVPLPNSLHMEWAMRAVRAGKHVLVEKPFTATAEEAERLFGLPELRAAGAPVVLEASHHRFHPAVQKFLGLIDAAAVEHVHTDVSVPWAVTAKGNIEFNHALGGGSMMMLGTYGFSLIRMAFGAEPAECLSCETRVFGDGEHDACDTHARALFRFPNGGTADAESNLRGRLWWDPCECRVTMREVPVPDPDLGPGQQCLRRRTVALRGTMHAVVWHRIDVHDTYTIRDAKGGAVVKTWTEQTSHKAYSFADAGGAEFEHLPGEHWWMSFRYQLEAFVDRVRGRPTQHWVDPQDSINQMRMLDMAYEKSGLGARPTSKFW